MSLAKVVTSDAFAYRNSVPLPTVHFAEPLPPAAVARASIHKCEAVAGLRGPPGLPASMSDLFSPRFCSDLEEVKPKGVTPSMPVTVPIGSATLQTQGGRQNVARLKASIEAQLAVN